jgi:hypothetical protein
MSEKRPQKPPQEIKLAMVNELAASSKTLDFPGAPGRFSNKLASSPAKRHDA